MILDNASDLILKEAQKILDDSRKKQFGEHFESQEIYISKCTSFIKDCIFKVNNKIPDLLKKDFTKSIWDFYSAESFYDFLENKYEENSIIIKKITSNIKKGDVLIIKHILKNKFTGHCAIVKSVQKISHFGVPALKVTVIDSTEKGHGQNDFRINGGVGEGSMLFLLDNHDGFKGEYLWHELSNMPISNPFLFVTFKEFTYNG